MKPTLHLTNLSSKSLHGPGLKLTIMAAPRSWEHGDGRVMSLMPDVRDLRAVQAGHLSWSAYRMRFEEGMRRALAEDVLSPGVLSYVQGALAMYVPDGATLFCSCSVQKAKMGACHRTMAAPFLEQAGWRVLLDEAIPEAPSLFPMFSATLPEVPHAPFKV